MPANKILYYYYIIGSVAERVKAPFLWKQCDHTLLHPWIRRFTMIISAWWLRTSSKLSGKKSKIQPENSEMDNS